MFKSPRTKLLWYICVHLYALFAIHTQFNTLCRSRFVNNLLNSSVISYDNVPYAVIRENIVYIIFRSTKYSLLTKQLYNIIFFLNFTRIWKRFLSILKFFFFLETSYTIVLYSNCVLGYNDIDGYFRLVFNSCK